jgi:hypothetical protein
MHVHFKSQILKLFLLNNIIFEFFYRINELYLTKHYLFHKFTSMPIVI